MVHPLTISETVTPESPTAQQEWLVQLADSDQSLTTIAVQIKPMVLILVAEMSEYSCLVLELKSVDDTPIVRFDLAQAVVFVGKDSLLPCFGRHPDK